MKKHKSKDKKPGHVIRVDVATWNYIEKMKRDPGEKTSVSVRRLLGLPPKKGEYQAPKTYYVLPESMIVCESKAEARGLAILQAVKKGKEKPTEKPVEVKAVG